MVSIACIAITIKKRKAKALDKKVFAKHWLNNSW